MCTNTYRDASFIKVGKTFLQLCVQNLLWNHNEPWQADRKQTEDANYECYFCFFPTRALTLSWCFDRHKFYLVDISKRSLTEVTLHPEAPHLSSSCSQSETDSHQFMWESRGRLLRNCFISGGRVIQRRHVLHIWVSGGARAALQLFGVKTQEQVRYCFTTSKATILRFFLL